MKKRIPLMTGFLLLLAGAVGYRYEPPFLAGLCRRAFDIFLEYNARPVQTDRVVLVDINDESLVQYGQWPWPRTRMGTLMSSLWKNGAAAVVFDVIFIEPDRTSPVELSRQWKNEFGAEVQISGLSSNLWNFDSVFAGGLAQGASVLGCFMEIAEAPLTELPERETGPYRGRFFEKGKPVRAWLPQAGGSLQPVPELAEAAAGIAFINTLPDRDGIVRSTPLVFAYGPGRIYPALSLEAIRLFTGAEKAGIIYDTSGIEGVREIQILNRNIPTDGHGRLRINYRSTRFASYSAADVLRGDLPDSALRDKIVLVGTSAAGLQDQVSTPLAADFPGAEVHATAVDNMLAGDMLSEPRWMPYVCLWAMLTGGLVVTLLVVYTPALLSLLVMLSADAVLLGASCFFLRTKQLVVPPVETIAVWGIVFIGVTAVKYWQEERERKKVRKMFGTMVSPSVLNYLEQNPGSFSLSGAKADATVFFSDVAGFTTISESLEPARLAGLLNR
ncbi:MAG: CHASE2 domain-containing protein, partial [Pontiellaceae bacterium]|nr:CHASE2 domain-containing protein [Pontiellaceae bacterium]